MSGQKVAAAGVTLVTLAFIALFLRFSYWGRAVRAVSQNRLGASLAGIDATAVSSLVFALAGGLAALAGALLSPIINASPDVGAFPAIKSYVIVVLGGMGSILGAFSPVFCWALSKASARCSCPISTATRSASFF